MTLTNLKSEVKDELYNLLDFWINYSVDQKNGGFYGTINGKNIGIDSVKSAVATARILWGFSSAIEFLNAHPELPNRKEYITKLEPLCQRAYEYLIANFWDKKYGGVYWNVSATGRPDEPKKQIYAHSFFVYGMSEYFRATSFKPALEWAKKGFDAIIEHSYDSKNGGYVEAYNQDWSETDQYILSDGDRRKSMNTHLHLLECFANLYRVDKSEKVRFHLQHCLEIMLDHIIGKDKTRMTLFFTDDWQLRDKAISYGHDIEASWLVLEAAEILGNEHLIEYCKDKCLAMARDAAEGLQSDNGMIYEFNPENGHSKSSRDWWVMAEAMVGFYNAYQLSKKIHHLEKAENCWQFIKDYLIDHEGGEWWGGVNADHELTGTTKASPWKAPYHNLRSCMEIYRRIG